MIRTNDRPSGPTSVARIALLSTVVALSALGIAGCGDDKLAVGKCVILEDGVLNDDLTETNCEKTSAKDKLDGKSIYRIVSVIEYEAKCPRSTDVTFDHEPHDATYCLDAY